MSGNPVNVMRGRVVTSEIEDLKTKEIQKRRRLRLQQVRDQSKIIAKTVRERADKERVTQLDRVVTTKKEDHIQRQERLVQRLEQIHAQSLQSVGTAHSEAAISNDKEKPTDNTADQSKPRGILAAAELKKNQQRQLDKKKQLLDRKLIARNLANARSRLKLSKATTNELTEEVSSGVIQPGNAVDVTLNSDANGSATVCHRVVLSAENLTSKKSDNSKAPCEPEPSRRDMETQWSVDGLREWIPSGGIAAEAPENSDSQNEVAANIISFDQNVERRKDLFAVSEEMPESLRRCDDKTAPPTQTQRKPSLCIVSDFLRTRDHRLQKPEAGFHRVTDHELQGLRETFRTRKDEGTASICRVMDKEAIPVPSWQPVPNCGFCTFDTNCPVNAESCNSNLNECYVKPSRSRSELNLTLQEPVPFLRLKSPLHPPILSRPQNTSRTENPRTSRTSGASGKTNCLIKKPSVMHYDHNTKSIRDLPLDNSNKLVEKVTLPDILDAYSLALKESEETVVAINKKHHEQAELKRSRVAVSRQKVAQEYKDTMAFLQSVSRESEKSKPIETAYMNDYRQNKRKAGLQRRLQNEFEKVQAEAELRAKSEARRETSKSNRRVSKLSPTHRQRPGSANKFSSNDGTAARSSLLNDAELLLKHIRTLPGSEIPPDVETPNKDKSRKAHKVANTVTFDFEPAGYQYVPSVKQTPPTRDKPESSRSDKLKKIDSYEDNKLNVNNDTETENTSDNTVISNCSSDYDLIIQKHTKAKVKRKETGDTKSDVRKFIVYKVKDSSDEDNITKKLKKKTKLTAGKSSKCEIHVRTEENNVIGDVPNVENNASVKLTAASSQDNIERHGEQRNDELLKVQDKDSTTFFKSDQEETNLLKCSCSQKRLIDGSNETPKVSSQKSAQPSKQPLNWDIGTASTERQEECDDGSKMVREIGTQPTASAATSAATFRTASSEKSEILCSTRSPVPGGYVKVLDEAGEEAGMFYIGTGQPMCQHPYELIVQLKRKIDVASNENNNVQITKQKSAPLAEEKVKPDPAAMDQKMPILSTPVHDAQFSSSSSTVYMSPPDLIIPKLLKSVYQIPEDDVYRDPKIKSLYVEQTRGQPLSYCNRRDFKDETSAHNLRKEVASSGLSKEKKSIVDQPASSRRESRKKKSKRKCGCHRCIKRERDQEIPKESSKIPQICSKLAGSKRKETPHHYEKKIIKIYKNQLHNLILKDIERRSETEKSTKHKSNISPVVQKYINELLEMSKDGLNGIEAATLQCSTVSTPGSSIINVPSNVDATQSFKERENIFAKINEMITEYLTRKLKKPISGHKKQLPLFGSATSSDSQSIEKGIGDIPQLNLIKKRHKPKVLYRHKIKSLNISKNIHKYFKTFDLEERKKSVYFTKSAARLTSTDFEHKSSEIEKEKNPLSKLCPKIRKTRQNITAQKNVKGKTDNNNLTEHEKVPFIRKTTSSPLVLTTLFSKDNNPLQTQENKIDININSYNGNGIAKNINVKKKVSVKLSPPVKQDKTIYNVENDTINSNSCSIHTTHNADNLMQAAEKKLQNMEKIAELTEKCTKRLSNLAKVLEEVRKNKSNMYNQLSSADTSLSEHSSCKATEYLKNKYEKEHLRGEVLSCVTNNNIPNVKDPGSISNTPRVESAPHKDILVPTNQAIKDCYANIDAIEFVPILSDIPKPKPTSNVISDFGTITKIYNSTMPTHEDAKICSENEGDDIVIKTRSRPPPALSRINLNNEETLIAHELSTVLEVDSPLSIRNASSKIKSQSPININVIFNGEREMEPVENKDIDPRAPMSIPGTPPVTLYITKQPIVDDKLLAQNSIILADGTNDNNAESELRKVHSNVPKNTHPSPLSLHQQEEFTTENNKLKMMDLNKFNEIMLKPFISIEEYARQFNIALLEEGSNVEDTNVDKKISKIDDEISSVNSDATLPDIISELLKRNVITEPFNYDGASNTESRSLSSESNMSMRALSKIKRHKKKVTINTCTEQNDNGDTSDTISFSSKIDLERAFEELGIGWASSTLKKTKETLALSSSTSTMSSMEHTNHRKFNKSVTTDKLLRHLRGMITDMSKNHSVTAEQAHTASVLGSRYTGSEGKENKPKKSTKSAKRSVELQTLQAFEQPISVKEFLASSLASKITFSNKSPRREDEHFSSLYSTKQSMDSIQADDTGKLPASDSSVNHNASKQNSRQRTSTPVQLFKSLNFNSSTSSYNNSNGLLSNFDDLSSVKGTSVSLKNGSSSDKDELTVPNCSLRVSKKGSKSDCSDGF